ncbi:MAG TPA: ribulose phosphate epimerase [Treponema sp.]|nr:ribulose phosphate epimerase [Treponema sp.]
MAECAVSLWSADLGNLESEVKKMNQYADYFHIDVGDGYYTPSLLFFPDLTGTLRKVSQRPFEIHVMAERPERIVDSFIGNGADIIDIHPESFRDPVAELKLIRDSGLKTGIVISLQSDTEKMMEYLATGLVDMCVCLGQTIGCKGKDPDPRVYETIGMMRKFIDEKKLDVRVEADGGIREYTVEKLVQNGADVLVPGSLAFKTDYTKMMPWLHSLKKATYGKR